MTRLKLALAALLCALVLFVILQNTEAVETKILMSTLTMPRAFLVGVVFGAGILFGLLLAAAFGSKSRS